MNECTQSVTWKSFSATGFTLNYGIVLGYKILVLSWHIAVVIFINDVKQPIIWFYKEKVGLVRAYNRIFWNSCSWLRITLTFEEISFLGYRTVLRNYTLQTVPPTCVGSTGSTLIQPNTPTPAWKIDCTSVYEPSRDLVWTRDIAKTCR